VVSWEPVQGVNRRGKVARENEKRKDSESFHKEMAFGTMRGRIVLYKKRIFVTHPAPSPISGTERLADGSVGPYLETGGRIDEG
jgi:hypothetical protein